MDKRNFNLIVATVTFLLGGLYIVADTPSLNANVIGYADSPVAFGSALGVVLIIASAAFFLLILGNHHNKDLKLDQMVRGVENRNEELLGKDYVDDTSERYGLQHHSVHAPAHKKVEQEE